MNRAEAEAREGLAELRRQHRWTVAALIVVAVFFVLGGIAFWQWTEARAATQTAEASARRAIDANEKATAGLKENTRLLDLRRVADADRAASEYQDVLARSTLDAVTQENRGLVWRILDRRLAGGTFVLSGHVGGIAAVAWSPDGHRLVSVGNDRTIRTWDTRTGGEVTRTDCGPERFTTAAVLSDGRHVATADPDGTVRLWDVETGRVTRTLGTPSGRVVSLAASADGRRVVALADRFVRVWLLADGREVLRVTTGNAPAYRPFTVAISDDGGLVAALSVNSTCIWDGTTGTKLAENGKHGNGGNGLSGNGRLAFTPDRSGLVTDGWYGFDGIMAFVLDARTAALRRRLAGAASYPGCTGVAVSPDGGRVAAAHETFGVLLWDIHTGQFLDRFACPGRRVSAMSFSPRGDCLVAGCDDGTLRVWSLRASAGLDGYDADRTQQVAHSADGTRVAGVVSGVGLCVWDTLTRKRLRTISDIRPTEVGLALSSDGTRAMVVGPGGAITTWDVAAGKQVGTVTVTGGTKAPPRLSADGRRVVPQSGRTVRVHDTGTGLLAHEFAPVSDRAVEAARVAAAGTTVVVAWERKNLGDEGEVWACDAATGGCRRAEGMAASDIGLPVSADGRLVVLAEPRSDEFPDNLCVFDTRTWAVRFRLDQFLAEHTALDAAFGPDGDSLVVRSHDGTIRAFDARTGHESMRLRTAFDAFDRSTPEHRLAVRDDGIVLVVKGEVMTIDGRPLSPPSVTTAATRPVTARPDEAWRQSVTRPAPSWHGRRWAACAERGDRFGAAFHAAAEWGASGDQAMEAGDRVTAYRHWLWAWLLRPTPPRAVK